MKNNITIERYQDLSENDKLWYAPDYAKYKIKRTRRYETCDLGHEHYMGWDEESIPIGDPVGYSKVTVFEHNLAFTQALMKPYITDTLNKTNVIMQRILKSQTGVVKVRWDKDETK